jgi:metallo-beta-lactamase class B
MIHKDRFRRSLAAVMLLLFGTIVRAQIPPAWNEEQKPFQVYGNTYYVGTKGLSSVLITSKEGHILIDGALPASAQMIVAHVRELGYRIEDVKLILNTHVHFDHAGGIAELQKLTGAKVAASPPTAKVMASGEVDNADPQYGQLPKITPIANVQVVKDGETLQVGSLSIIAHFTPGHTPGGTTWAWKSCEGQKCLNVVYADSLNPVSAKGFLYTDPKRKPNGATQLRGSYVVINALPCDILLTPHPEFSGMLDKLAQRERGSAGNPFIDANSCRTYVQASRDKLDKRIAEETGKQR